MDIRLSSPLLDFFVDVRLTSRGARWIAVAEIAGDREIGLGRTAHEALAASIGSLEPQTVAVLLADPGLMVASAEMR
jgi:hypothetical protein